MRDRPPAARSLARPRRRRAGTGLQARRKEVDRCGRSPTTSASRSTRRRSRRPPARGTRAARTSGSRRSRGQAPRAPADRGRRRGGPVGRGLGRLRRAAGPVLDDGRRASRSAATSAAADRVPVPEQGPAPREAASTARGWCCTACSAVGARRRVDAQRDGRSTAAHEFGHVLGLRHAKNTCAVMSYQREHGLPEAGRPRGRSGAGLLEARRRRGRDPPLRRPRARRSRRSSATCTRRRPPPASRSRHGRRGLRSTCGWTPAPGVTSTVVAVGRDACTHRGRHHSLAACRTGPIRGPAATACRPARSTPRAGRARRSPPGSTSPADPGAALLRPPPRRTTLRAP